MIRASRKRQTDLRAASASLQSVDPRHMKRDQSATLCGGTGAVLCVCNRGEFVLPDLVLRDT